MPDPLIGSIHRGYRPLHAHIQETPHCDMAKPSPERLACVEWMLRNGADPELTASWPPAQCAAESRTKGPLHEIAAMLLDRTS